MSQRDGPDMGPISGSGNDNVFFRPQKLGHILEGRIVIPSVRDGDSTPEITGPEDVVLRERDHYLFAILRGRMNPFPFRFYGPESIDTAPDVAGPNLFPRLRDRLHGTEYYSREYGTENLFPKTRD